MKRGGKFLLLLSGPVGSGKTYIAKILAKKLGALHVRADDLRVGLRRKGKSYSAVPRLAEKIVEEALREGRAVINDFDAVRLASRKGYKNLAQKFGAKFYLLEVFAPEKLILRRLRNKKYGKEELFGSAREATKVYFFRKKFREKILKKSKPRPNFIINNARPVAPQIKKVVEKIKADTI